jgi:hypothetical protein
MEHDGGPKWIGGWGTAALWQAGVRDSTQTLLWIQMSSHQAWWRLYPNALENNVFSVSAGDEVQAQVWICDPTFGYGLTTASNPKALLCTWIHDATSNDAFSAALHNTDADHWAYAFKTDDPVHEWNNGGRTDYAQFSPFNLCRAWDHSRDDANAALGSRLRDSLGYGLP